MKLALLAVALVAAVVAAPPEDSAAQLVRSDFDQQPDGGYNFNFEIDNGISRQETGELKEVPNEENKPQLVVITRGSYTYKDAEGKSHVVTYTADETGFHPESEDIPQPPARR